MPQIDERPYFMTNEEWYELKPDKNGIYELALTDKAPELARISYEEYMKQYEDLEDEIYPSIDDEDFEEDKIDKLFGI